MITKAVILAAGLGARSLPATKAQPKEMLPVVDRSIIQYVVGEAVPAGVEDIPIVTGRGKRAIGDHFDRALEPERYLERAHLELAYKEDLLRRVRGIAESVHIHFVRQQEPLGLGHAVLQARRHVGDEPFAVLLDDEIFSRPRPCLRELIDQSEALGGAPVVAVQSVPASEIHRYGAVAPEPAGPRLHRVRVLVEKPDPAGAPSNLAVIGRYVLPPAIFDVLADLPPGRGGEIQLTDALDRLCRQVPVYAYEPEARRYDVGDRLGYIQVTVEFAFDREDLGPALRAHQARLLADGPDHALAAVAAVADSHTRAPDRVPRPVAVVPGRGEARP